jgi:phosphocarrier protein HPr
MEVTVMYTSSIILSSIEAVKKFVTLTNSYNFPINLATDKYKIDAKSIMGIFSLDLSKPLKIEVDSEDANEFIQQIQQFQYQPVASKA